MQRKEQRILIKKNKVIKFLIESKDKCIVTNTYFIWSMLQYLCSTKEDMIFVSFSRQFILKTSTNNWNLETNLKFKEQVVKTWKTQPAE